MLAHDVPNLIEHPPILSSLRCGVSPGPLFPPESRTFRSNQHQMMSYLKKLLKATIFEKRAFQKEPDVLTVFPTFPSF
ncbi:hypothetical protein D9X91_20285 [Falsibacillus albus]|uniref:Uncharacterized protein n=1 Tax=Falsibacillus albus TaxID=2478915 RepID=A0A3L7JN70_9BACI|nr:hypothetical protein D9X91_20285 [Falsibacillus albus]